MKIDQIKKQKDEMINDFGCFKFIIELLHIFRFQARLTHSL